MKSLAGGSAYSGKLPTGCRQCARGGKMVLFVSGICDAKCFYCPLSTGKKMQDVMYADEMPLSNMHDAILEAKMIDAMGTGITGGDPLKYYERTSEYIKILKEEFGDSHHIHLYTISGTEKAIRTVAAAGLDEIRFHAPEEIWNRMDNSAFVNRIKWAQDTGMTVGIEVPSIPGTEDDTRALIEFSRRMDLDFINLNELEFSETNFERLLGRGHTIKNDVESGAKGSSELGLQMVREYRDYPVHYCSAAFKDGVQLKNRLKRRARNVARSIDAVTSDGTIIRGVIQGAEINDIVLRLQQIGVERELFHINIPRNRVEVPPWILPDLKKLLDLDMYEVEEYPTWDAIEVERLKI